MRAVTFSDTDVSGDEVRHDIEFTQAHVLAFGRRGEAAKTNTATAHAMNQESRDTNSAQMISTGARIQRAQDDKLWRPATQYEPATELTDQGRRGRHGVPVYTGFDFSVIRGTQVATEHPAHAT